MSTNQPAVVTSGVLDSVRGLLGGPTRDGDEWCFDLGEHLHSNWGAVYGGVTRVVLGWHGAMHLGLPFAMRPERSSRRATQR
jgi:hypothetical protein